MTSSQLSRVVSQVLVRTSSKKITVHGAKVCVDVCSIVMYAHIIHFLEG